MKRKFLLRNILVIIFILMLSTGCGNKENTNEKNNNTTKEQKISISGSTSVEKIGNATAEEFMALNPNVTVTYEAIGSSGGVKNANEGVTEIGTASRNLKDKEKEWGLIEKVIAYDGIAVITHPSNDVSDLTIEQIQKIYKGEITNWNEVGGKDEVIVVVSREDGSGTREAFESIVGFKDELTEKALLAEGNGNVQTTVKDNPKSIGYVSFAYINETVKPIMANGVDATIENVVSEQYAIARPFIMVYKEDNMSQIAEEYIEFVLSEEGQKIVEDNHGIPVK